MMFKAAEAIQSSGSQWIDTLYVRKANTRVVCEFNASKTQKAMTDRSGLIRTLHVDHLTFRRIVMTLHMCDAIIEESEYGRNVIYSIKKAA